MFDGALVKIGEGTERASSCSDSDSDSGSGVNWGGQGESDG